MDNTDNSYVLIHRIRAKTYGEEHEFDRSTLADCKTPDNFVMLFDSKFRPIEPANFFLRDHCYPTSKRRRGRWEKTQAAYADDLAVWWIFLKFMGLNWDEVTLYDIKYFIECLTTGVSSKTSREFSSSTVRRRMGTVDVFYRWAFAEGYIKESIGRIVARSIPKSGSMLAHVRRNDQSEGSGILPEQNSMLVSAIDPKDLPLILKQLGPPALVVDNDDKRPLRDRLIAETSLYTGMRAEEIACLTCYQILALERLIDDNNPWKLIPLTLTKTKGGRRERVVYPPSCLVKAWFRYFDEERTKIIEEARNRKKYLLPEDRPTPIFFVNSADSNNKNIAEPISTATITRNFTAAVLRSGLVGTESGYELDPRTGAPLTSPAGARVPIELKVAAYTYHGLRHTYACQLYCSEKAGIWEKGLSR